MRTFSTEFQAKLDSDTFVPVVFCRLDYKYGTSTSIFTTPYYWSERAITYDGQAYESRIVKYTPLEQALDSSNQAFGEMGMQISNYPTNLSGVVQSGMRITVYLGFEDSVGSGTVTYAEEIFVGTISGDLEITEESLSFSMIDVAHSYDSQIPAKIVRGKYQMADPDSIGEVKPIVIGRVKNHECKPVMSGFATTLAEPIQAIKKANVKQRIIEKTDDSTRFFEFYISDDADWYRKAIRQYCGRNVGYYGDGVADTTDTPPTSYQTYLPSKQIWAYIGNSIGTAFSFNVVDFDYDETKGLWKVLCWYNRIGFESEDDPWDNNTFGYDEFGYILNSDETKVSYSDDDLVPIEDEKTYDIKVGTQITFIDPLISYSSQFYPSDVNGLYRFGPKQILPYYARPNHCNTYNVFYFLVADHPVGDVRNVRINNIPIERLTDDNKHLLDFTSLYDNPDMTAATADIRETSNDFYNRKTFYKLYNGDYAEDYTPMGIGRNNLAGEYIDGVFTFTDNATNGWDADLEYATTIPKDYTDETRNPAVIAIFQPANKTFLSQVRTGGDQANLVGGYELEDTTEVIDTIDVFEPGHRHAYDEETLYQHEVDFSWDSIIFGGNGSVLFEIQSGSYYQVVVLQGNVDTARSGFNKQLPPTQLQIPAPWRFTSDSPTWTMHIGAFARYIGNYTNIVDINYTAVVTNVVTGASLSTMGSVIDLTTLNAGTKTNSIKVHPEWVGDDYVTNPGYALAEAGKTGTVEKLGGVALLGSLTLNANSASDAFLGGNVTCDVIGVCDGSMTPETGVYHIPPYEMIRKFIDRYAINQVDAVDYSETESGITLYENQDELEDYFNYIYNVKKTDDDTDYDGVYKKLNYEPRTSDFGYYYTNKSIGYHIDLPDEDLVTGMHTIDFAITEPNRFRDILGEMLFHSMCVVNWRNGLASLKFQPNSPVEDAVFTKQDIVMKSMSLTRKDLSKLGTKIHTRYDYNPVKGFERELDFTANRTGRKGSDETGYVDFNARLSYGDLSQERNEDLPMVRDACAAEILSQRLYNMGLGGKYISRFDTVIKNLALECGDFISVEMPVLQNTFMTRAVVTRRVIKFGSAVDRDADLITFELDQNYNPEPTKIVADTLDDSIGITDYVQTFLNYEGENFLDLTDTITITDDPDYLVYPNLTDIVTITESLGFNKEIRLSDSVTIEGRFRRSSPLFWTETLSDSTTISDVCVAQARDSVYENGVFIETDLTQVGVFE
jgi:hypothetical protein